MALESRESGVSENSWWRVSARDPGKKWSGYIETNQGDHVLFSGYSQD